MPYIFSRDARGNERNFLADYYRTTRELASNIFRKGYQWPFHATRMLDFGSSLLDLAVFRETRAGRKVFMDFNRNPLARARRRRLQSRPARRRRARLSRQQRGVARQADRPPAQDEPALDRALQALQIRHHARPARICDQQPAHERRPRGRHMGLDQPRGLLRGRRGGGDAWRHPAGRRRAQCGAGVRHALRRASRGPPKPGALRRSERWSKTPSPARLHALRAGERTEGLGHPQGSPGPDERSRRNPLRPGRRQGRRGSGARAQRNNPAAGNRLRRRQRGVAGPAMAPERDRFRGHPDSARLLPRTRRRKPRRARRLFPGRQLHPPDPNRPACGCQLHPGAR